MPFVMKKGGGEEDDGSGAVDRTSLDLGLDPLACPVCRRELLPWQDRCPDDDAAPVHRSELPPADDPLLARLLAEDPDATRPDAEPGADPDAEADPDAAPHWPSRDA